MEGSNDDSDRENHAEKKEFETEKRVKLLYLGEGLETVLFTSPYCTQFVSFAEQVVIEISAEEGSFTFKIAENTHVYHSVTTAFLMNGFTQVNDESFSVLLTSSVHPADLQTLQTHQMVNHFPGAFQLGRKDLLWININRQRKKFGREYDIAPETFVLPGDFQRLLKEKEKNKQLFWIRKPVASSCGHGISIHPSTARLKNSR